MWGLLFRPTLHTVSQKKHVTKSSMISQTRIVRLQQFLSHLLIYQDYRPLTDVFFIFPPHLFRAPTLPWETVKT